MPTTSQTFDETVYRKRLDDLCTRLKQANIRVDATRLDSYRRTFAKVEKIVSEGRVRQLPDEVDLETLLNDLEESGRLSKHVKRPSKFEGATMIPETQKLEALLHSIFLKSKTLEPFSCLAKPRIRSLKK